MAKPKVIEQIAALPASDVMTVTDNLIPATRGRPKRELDKTTEVQQTCKVCGASYTANQNAYKDGSVVITPPRCKLCQTRHVTNGRVNKVITGFKHLGNIKSRLTSKQREAIVDVLGNELKVLMDVYAGTSVSTGGFDLKNI